VIALPALWGAGVALDALSSAAGAASVPVAVGRGVVAACSALAVAVLVYSACWHLWRRRNRPGSGAGDLLG
jgi:hypothetical protein